ncbi:MAG TPA: protein kinase [Polyangiaceae bacterium]|jgi:serine/threonine-protein kinase
MSFFERPSRPSTRREETVEATPSRARTVRPGGESDADDLDEQKPPPAGTLVDGLYRVIRSLGRGGMGVVMLARDEVLDRDVALKLIRPPGAGSGLRDRFLTEARAMARVNHPNVLQIYAFGHFEETPYLVMEFVDGRTVADWLKEAKRGGTLPDLDMSLRVLDAMCLGTQAIHDANTLHCDLKPSNVLLDGDLRVRVADLGLAELVRDLQSSGRREIAGTTWYMAPEIALEHEVEPHLLARADVYSLGCIAYELLTGRVPFDGPTALATLLDHILGRPPPPSTLRAGLDPEFDEVVMRALAKDPAQRTPSAEAFRRELAAARGGTREPAGILIAEDDRDSREILEIVLREQFPHAQIETVADGAQALAAFDAHRHSVAIIDLRMPHLDGLELTGLLRARDTASRVPIIVLTAEGGADEWRRLSAMGADGFLVKPVHAADVVTLVRRALADRSRSVPPPAATG